MKELAMRMLNNAIQELDREIPHNYQNGSFKTETEKIGPSNEEELQRHLLNSQAILARVDGVETAVAKILNGKNKLTPTLTSRGWMSWKEPLLTESEQEAVELAVARFAQTKSAQARLLKDKLYMIPKEDEYSLLVMWSSVLDIIFSCLKQLSTDLKKILHGDKTQCAYHPGNEPVAQCVNCRKVICADCRVLLDVKNYCQQCASVAN
jgi:hypothetical protein